MSGPTERLPDAAVGSAPAKLILFGEHAVLYGQPALGMALSCGVRATLRRGTGRVRIELPADRPPPARTSATPRDLFEACLGADHEVFDADIVLDVPPCAGLGTSAAIAVALLRARYASLDTAPTRDELLARAMEVEHLAHGTSSGLDPAICVEGGVVSFRRRDGKPRSKRIRLAASFHVVVGVAGTHGGTAAKVRGLAQLKESAPGCIEAAIDTLGKVANTGERALIEGELALAGHAADLAHGVLAGLGLVSDRVEGLVRAARARGALGAKMSGAGGNGALYAFASDIQTAQAIVERWRAEDAEAWIETAS